MDQVKLCVKAENSVMDWGIDIFYNISLRLTFHHQPCAQILGPTDFPNADGIGWGCNFHSKGHQICWLQNPRPRQIALKRKTQKYNDWTQAADFILSHMCGHYSLMFPSGQSCSRLRRRSLRSLQELESRGRCWLVTVSFHCKPHNQQPS